MARIGRRRRRKHCGLVDRPRPRVFRDRLNPLEDLSRENVFKRILPETILYITGLLFNQLERQTLRNSPLPPLYQTLICLRYLACGTNHMLIGDSMNVSRASVGRVIVSVCTSLSNLAGRFIRWPKDIDSLRKVKQGFYNIAGFPDVTGCTDGTQIRIQAPNKNEEDFVNRKGYHSINVQMICDPWFKITDCVAKWPGSVHDNRIFKQSAICACFERGEIDGMLLGDSGYALRNFLMIPYLTPTSDAEKSYNQSLCKTRVLIEQTFGILKRRFTCLHNEIRSKPDFVCKFVVACSVLHNIGIDRGDICPYDLPDFNDFAKDNTHKDGDGVHVRQYITNTYFASK